MKEGGADEMSYHTEYFKFKGSRRTGERRRWIYRLLVFISLWWCVTSQSTDEFSASEPRYDGSNNGLENVPNLLINTNGDSVSCGSTTKSNTNCTNSDSNESKRSMNIPVPFDLHLNLSNNLSISPSFNSSIPSLYFNGSLPTSNSSYSPHPFHDTWKWLSQLGVPDKMPPAAWCSNSSMTVAVPVPMQNSSVDSPLEKENNTTENLINNTAIWQLLPRLFSKDELVNTSALPPDLQNEAIKNRLADKECINGKYVPQFYMSRLGQMDAWVGSVNFGKCGGFSVESETNVYHLNIFRPPGLNNNVLVSCSCEKETQHCTPTARWESTIKSKLIWNRQDESQDAEILSPLATSLGGGSLLSASMTAGQQNEVTVSNKDERLVFESHIMGVGFYPWPHTCELVDPPEKENIPNEKGSSNFIPSNRGQPLIIGGCPVSRLLQFKVHKAENVEITPENPNGQPQGAIIFSVIPSTYFEDYSPSFMRIRCRMDAYETPQKVDNFCLQQVVESDVVMYNVMPKMPPSQSKNSDKNERQQDAFEQSGRTKSSGNDNSATNSKSGGRNNHRGKRKGLERSPSSSSKKGEGERGTIKGTMDGRKTRKRKNKNRSSSGGIEDDNTSESIIGPGKSDAEYYKKEKAKALRITPQLSRESPTSAPKFLSSVPRSDSEDSPRFLSSSRSSVSSSILSPSFSAKHNVPKQDSLMTKVSLDQRQKRNKCSNSNKNVLACKLKPSRRLASRNEVRTSLFDKDHADSRLWRDKITGEYVMETQFWKKKEQKEKEEYRKEIQQKKEEKERRQRYPEFYKLAKHQEHVPTSRVPSSTDPPPTRSSTDPNKWKIPSDIDMLSPASFATLAGDSGEASAYATMEENRSEFGSLPGSVAPDQLSGQMATNEVLYGQEIKRYVPLGEHFVNNVKNDIVYGSYAVQWNHDRLARETGVKVGNNEYIVGGNVNLAQRATNWDVAARRVVVTVGTDEVEQLARVGVSRGNYGVIVDRSNLLQSTGVEVIARAVGTGTLIDQLDRNYGQRVRVRNFEMSIRHDFTDSLLDAGLATALNVNYRSVDVTIGTDRFDQQVGVSVGLRGYQFSVVRDFDERMTDLQGNWGNGWQLVLTSDFVDPFSSEILAVAGFGKLGRAYTEIGAGIGADGIPQAEIDVQTADVGLGLTFVDNEGEREAVYSITVGKFSYIFETELVADNIRLPSFLGIGPAPLAPLLG